jgi:hypothetical protein
VNRVGSCGIIAIDLRTRDNSTFDISIPSIRTLPLFGSSSFLFLVRKPVFKSIIAGYNFGSSSISLNRAYNIDDFPAPVLPQTPIFSPPFKSNETFFKT